VEAAAALEVYAREETNCSSTVGIKMFYHVSALVWIPFLLVDEEPGIVIKQLVKSNIT